MLLDVFVVCSINMANNFLSFSDFTDRYNIETNFLTFQGVISAVKALWKSNVANLLTGNAIHESITDTFFTDEKTE